MKKKIIIIVSFVLVIAVIVGLAVVVKIRKPADGTQNDINSNVDVDVQQKSLMDLKTIDEFQKFVEENNIEHGITENKMIASLLNVQFVEEKVSITYYFEADGKATDASAVYFFNAQELENGLLDVSEISLQEVASKSEQAMLSFCNMFDIESIPDVYLTNNDGSFTKAETEANYQSIMDGSSVLKLSIRDEDGYFWEMKISSLSGAITVSINKYFNTQAYMDYVANISLYEEKE